MKEKTAINVIKTKSNKQDKKVEALTIEEQIRFVDALPEEKYKNIFMIALFPPTYKTYVKCPECNKEICLGTKIVN